MSIWFMDGFDHYTNDAWGSPGTLSTNVDMLKKWTTVGGTVGTQLVVSPFYARQQPGQGLLMSTSATCNAIKVRPGGSTQNFICGAGVMFTAIPATNVIFSAYETATDQCSLRGDGAGHLTVTRNGTVLATSTNVISLNVWYWIEFKTSISNVSGTYEVRVNGTSTGWIPPATGANTRATANNYYTSMLLSPGGNGTRFDDFYVGDGTSDFLGNQMITTIRPVAAGNYAQWTPNFGANFGNVNELYPDGDSTFNQSSTANNIDSFVFQDLPMASGTVSAIQHVLFARQDGGGARVIAPLQRSSGTDYVGTSLNLSTSYQCLTDIKQTNPATSGTYTIAEINNAEFGYKLVS